MPASQTALESAIAVTRFGLGARQGEIEQAQGDPRGWLKAQIRREGAEVIPTDGETGAQRFAAFRAYRRERMMAERTAEDSDEKSADLASMSRRLIRQSVIRDAAARIRLACDTDASFRERWTLFWANHFTVSATKAPVAVLAGPFENEAIRPHVFGRFADLLGAAETHPAMLLYLDQAQSIGPNSLAAQRRSGGRRSGLNENLAREILELHTVGVDGGYSQADVTEFARALTGLSVPGPRETEVIDPVVFRTAAHEPGERTVMGVRYAAGGTTQARDVLADLAAKPQTARFICTKIARHFVADDPPASLVTRLERVWLASGGDLGQVAEALIDAPEAWAAEPAKFKTPYEFVVSSYRATGWTFRNAGQAAGALNSLGQRPFGAPSPKGWPDEAASWIASDALVKRLQFAQSLGAVAGPRIGDPTALAQAALGARLGVTSATAIARAESRAEAVALLLMTPEFQRR